MRRFFSVRLVSAILLLLLLCAACTPTKGETAPVVTTPTAAPLTFSFLLMQSDPVPEWGSDSVSAYLQERFQLHIDITHVSMDGDRAIQSLCAAGMLPDALYLRRNEQFLWLIEQGHLLPLDRFLSSCDGYISNISSRALELSRVRGSVYSLLSYSTEQPSGTGGWILRKDFYRQLGSPPLETLEDVYSLALSARSLVASPILFGSSFDFSQIYVAYGEGRNPRLFQQHIYLVPGTQSFRFIGEDPAFAESVLFVRRLFENGLLPADWFLLQRDQICAQLESGEFLLYAANDITGYPLNALQSATCGEYIVLSPPRANIAQQDTIYSSAYDLLGTHGISISTSAQEPQRICLFFDFLASDEGQRLVQFGPPGLLYHGVNDAGYPLLTEEAQTLSPTDRVALGLGQWAYPCMPDYTQAAFLFANAQCPDTPWSLAAQWGEQVLDRHSLNVTAMANIEPNCPGTERSAILLCDDLYTAYLPRMFCASTDEEALYLLDEMNRQVQAAGFDFVLAHFNWFYRENLSK